ncbi:MAG TPA: asparaginase [Candidatus Gastranaerophilaceae bacterium]|nr:asparaginase [Candidatus Gastranaerophilaceae bacterium]HPT41230.1 asparaginase [Candidatus Gastranaerophilaceae bacterium]
MDNYTPAKLIEYIRDGLIEQEHLGFVVKVGKNIQKIGNDKNYPFYLRSCAKPLQASLLIDYEIDKTFNMTDEEIAVCCASHAGELCHTQTIEGLLNKINLSKENLKCSTHVPFSRSAQKKLLIEGLKESVLQNNCSGKHAMMLSICKKMGWEVNDYYNIDHPLQIAIKKKIYDLCEVKKEYTSTKDGCGVPIFAMPLENMIKGYLNLFFDKKYEKIKNAFLNKPYFIGGEERIDTAIMCANPDLIAKIGAGGLCIVINLKKKEGIMVKIMDCDMKARSIVLIEALKQLKWLDKDMLENPLIKFQNQRNILTLHLEKVGEITPVFNLT